MQKIIIYTDGGARGNPGPAAIGVMFPDFKKGYSDQIGVATNNVAEYRAVIFALKKAKQILGKDKCGETNIEIRSDSELLVNQMNGEYKVKEGDIQKLFVEVWNLMTEFKSVSFVHVRREENKEADAALNRALDTLV